MVSVFSVCKSMLMFIPANRRFAAIPVLIKSAAANKRDNFHAISCHELCLGVLAARNKIQIAFHGQHPRIEF
jgi:hypothetical protein